MAPGCAMLAFLFLFLFTISRVDTHSFLIDPPADWKETARAECRVGGPNNDPQNCPGPCIAESSWSYNQHAPTTTWEAGSKVTVRWTRNNHKHGFIRLSLVPEFYRMSHAAHEQYAFHYACWESNKRSCDDSKYFCGTDIYLYETNVTVPNVPAGKYVLGWTWFGAYDGEKSRVAAKVYNFGDYWSCANIQVKTTGRPHVHAMPTFIPQTFVTGTTDRNGCWSMVDRIGRCVREPCLSSSLPNLPVVQSDGTITMKRPPALVKPAELRLMQPTISPSPTTPLPTVTTFVQKHLKSRKWADCGCQGPHNPPVPSVINLLLIPLDFYGFKHPQMPCICLGQNRNVHLNPDGGYTIVAQVIGNTSEVRFFVNTIYVHTERHEPYAISGNTEEKFVVYGPSKYNHRLLISADIKVPTGYGGMKRINITFLTV